MTANEYRQHFLAGLDLLTVLDPHHDQSHIDREKSYLASADLTSHRNSYGAVVMMAAHWASQMISQYDPWDVIGRRCHDFSHGFLQLWREKTKGGLMECWLTVGEVRHRGESVYDITKEKVEACVRRGYAPAEPLGVHVWLTFEDMSILDLTIMASLLRLGWVNEQQYLRHSVVAGRPEDLGDFEFLPFLVDNNFRAKVER